jgi:hypothetical protein
MMPNGRPPREGQSAFSQSATLQQASHATQPLHQTMGGSPMGGGGAPFIPPQFNNYMQGGGAPPVANGPQAFPQMITLPSHHHVHGPADFHDGMPRDAPAMRVFVANEPEATSDFFHAEHMRTYEQKYMVRTSRAARNSF